LRPTTQLKWGIIIELAVTAAAAISAGIMILWNVDNIFFGLLYVIGAIIAVAALLIDDKLETHRIEFLLPETAKSRRIMYLFMGIATIGVFLFVISVFGTIGERTDSWSWRICMWSVFYFCLVIGMFLVYLFWAPSWKGIYEELEEDIYTLRYRPPGEIAGHAIRVDPSIEKDVSGIKQWTTGRFRILNSTIGLAISTSASIMGSLELLSGFSNTYFMIALIFGSLSIALVVRIFRLYRYEPYVASAEFIANKKTLASLQKRIVEKYHLTSSGSLTSLFDGEVLPARSTVEFRNSEGEVGLSIVNMSLVTDDDKKNKHMMGMIKVARAVFREKILRSQVIQDIEACFPNNRRKVEVLLY